MVVTIAMKDKTEEERLAEELEDGGKVENLRRVGGGGDEEGHHHQQQQQLNHLPILKGILDGVVDYHNAPVRFGRVPKREKARILAAMHQSCQSRSAERAAVAEQLNGVTASQLTASNGSNTSNGGAPASENGGGSSSNGQHGAGAHEVEPKEEGLLLQGPQAGGATEWKESPNAAAGVVVVGGPAEELEGPEDELEANRLANTVLRAHSDTCHFAHLRPKEGQGCPRSGQASSGGPVYSVQGRNGPILACPLNPRRPLVAGLTPEPNGRGEDTLLQDFSQRFSPAIRGVVEFAKRIPGFALLSQSDQVTLLKAGVFEVLLLRLACLFDSQTNTMTCLNGELLRREAIVSHSSPSSSPSRSPSSHASNARFLVDSMFEFAARLNALQLSDAELALFSAVVIIAPDRPGLRHTDLISRIHGRLLSSLSMLLGHSHPSGTSPPELLNTLQSYIPDLRTLNTLHSEKLLAFKMTEQQQQNGSSTSSSSPPSSAEEEVAMHHQQQSQQQQQMQQHRRIPVEEEHHAMQQQQHCKQFRHQVLVQHHHHPSAQQQVGQAMGACPMQQQASMDGSGMRHHVQMGSHQDSWKVEEVHDVEDDDIVEEDDERWRSANGRVTASAISAVVSGLKSPLGSVSSSESICSGEVASLSEFSRSSVSASAPLLAATLSGGGAGQMAGFPKRRRHRDRSGSNSEEDTSCVAMQVTACPTQVTHMTSHRGYFRKLDSPSDSGIESGTERLEKSSTSTSVCSSPRSSLEDKEDAANLMHKVSTAPSAPQQQQQQQQRRCPHLERNSTMEDMPVLKRVLQAPPLYDTNSLMDEAYKPHKKFRALRKECPEAEATSPLAPPATGMGMPEMASNVRTCRLPEKTTYASLETVRQVGRPEASPVGMDHGSGQPNSPPIVVLSPPSASAQPASPHSIISTLNMHFPQITIHAQPMRSAPSPIDAAQQRGLSPQRNPPSPQQHPNRLSPGQSSSSSQSSSNPPLLLQKALLQPPVNQRSLQSHQHQALLSALSGETSPRPVASPPQTCSQQASSSPLTASLLSAPTLNSNLSSTHSTLARSLMEGPKMTAEQMKRTDIIHSYIMREGCEEPSSGYRKSCPQGGSYRQMKTSPEPVVHDLVAEDNNGGTSYRQVKPAQQSYRPSPIGGNLPSSKVGMDSGSPSQAPGVLVFNGSYLHMGWNGKQQQQQQQQSLSQQQSPANGDIVAATYSSPPPPPTAQASGNNKPSEVKQGGQPLNLSKKTPPPSPATTPIVTASIMEA